MPSISGPEIIVVLVIALIVLGPRKLPEMARSAGRGLREFRAGLSSDREDELDRDRSDERDEHALSGRPGGGGTP